MFTIVGYGRADWTLYRLAPLWKVMILAEGRSQNKHSLQVLAGNLALLIRSLMSRHGHRLGWRLAWLPV